MHNNKALCILLLCCFLVFSCSSIKKNQKKPTLAFHGLILSKDVSKQTSIAVPEDPTNNFSVLDSKVVALVRFENLSGRYRIRWDWYSPGGGLYFSTGDFPLFTTEGKYLKDATAWHSLNLKGDDAVEFPGEWIVKVFVNDDLADSKTFTLASEKKTVELPIDNTPRPYPTDWGLIIGIEDYSHLPVVNYAKKDALVMKDYFIKILRVPEENVITLINSDATKARIQGYLEKYIPSNITSETTLYVYFAGHGAPDMESGEPYLIPYDGDTMFIEQTGYNLKKFYNDIGKLRARQTYVFLDSCFSGSASRANEMLTKGARPALLNVKDIEFKQDRIVSISASSKGQISNAFPEKEHGLFTYYVLKAFDGDADANDDQWISVKEVYNYVYRQVNRVSRRLGAEQKPTIWPPLELLKDSALGRVKE